MTAVSPGVTDITPALLTADHVITDKKDPIKVAQDLAGFVKQYSLDGVDIDFEGGFHHTTAR